MTIKSYEAGPDTFQGGSADAKYNATLDSRMYTIITHFVSDWYAFDISYLISIFSPLQGFHMD
jgi:hypothetical protein